MSYNAGSPYEESTYTVENVLKDHPIGHKNVVS